MDLLSAAQVLLRRWYVTLPGGLLACCLALAGWTFVAPAYESDGSLLLRPPPVDGNDTTTSRTNPYLLYNNLQIPARVTQDVLTQRREREALQALGATGTFEVFLDPTGAIPLVTFRAVGDTADEAMKTASVAMARYSEVLVERQVKEGGSNSALITTEVVRPAITAEPLRGSKIRAALAALALGGILTLTAAFTVEAVNRRRQVSRSTSPGTRSDETPGVGFLPSGAAPATGAVARAPVALVPSDNPTMHPRPKPQSARSPGQAETGKDGPGGSVRVTLPRS